MVRRSPWWPWLVLGTACQPEAPAFTGPQTLGGVEIAAEVLEQGRGVYFRHCASCHGADGSGTGPAARALAVPPRDFRAGVFAHKSTPGDRLPTDADLARTIERGLIETGMPPWRGMPETDLHAVIQFIKTLSPRWRLANAVGRDPPSPEPENPGVVEVAGRQRP